MSYRIINFDEVYEFLPKSKMKASEGNDEGIYPFYTSSPEQSKYINEYDYNDESLIFGTGGLASIHYSPGCFSTTTDCIVAKPRDNGIDPKYTYYYLSGNMHILDEGFCGAGLKHISKSYIKNIKIPLPPLDIQKKIAAVLDRADRLRQKRKEAIEKLDQLVQSVFLDMFGDPVKNPKGWEIVKLDKVKANKQYSITAGPFGSNLTSKDYVTSGIPVIRGANMSQDIINNINDDYVFVSPDKAEQLKSNIAHPDDIIFTQRGTLAQVSWIDEQCDIPKFVVSQSQMKMTCNKTIVLPIFVLCMFKQPSIKQMILNSALTTGIPHTNLTILKNYSIILPPIELQHQFTSSFFKILKLKEDTITGKGVTDNLFNSLLQRAFKGELTFNDSAFQDLENALEN